MLVNQGENYPALAPTRYDVNQELFRQYFLKKPNALITSVLVVFCVRQILSNSQKLLKPDKSTT